MSSPCALRGDEDESTSSGAVPRFSDCGNVTNSAEIVADEEDALQGTTDGMGANRHDPTVDDATSADQHTHAVHPEGERGEQQQPLRHTSLAQSALLRHASPGGRR